MTNAPRTMEGNRQSTKEQARMHSVQELIPSGCVTALDVGCRRGKITRLLVDMVEHVTALDLEMPAILHDRITPVQGDVASLTFEDDSFDLVVCTEVLEHIKPHLLENACRELARVARQFVLVGVPYRQDIRVGRLTCHTCGKRTPPWGHLNIFNERRLDLLFSQLTVARTGFVGQNRDRTNFLSAWLMDLAGNPYGPYSQEERCVHCGSKLIPPGDRNLFQKAATKAAAWIRRAQWPLMVPQPNGIHALYRKH